MAYVTVDEFLRRIGKAPGTAQEQAQAQQCLDAATQEIDSYLSRLDTPPVLTPEQEALVAIVNVERAMEHWRILPFGALPSGGDLPPVLTARDSFYRHSRKLQSLKSSWGLA